MTYYNRRFQLINTLKTISFSSHKDFEVIVVDDGSDDDHDIRDLESTYSFLKVIRIDPKEKTWVNPCVPFNIGFKNANGEIIIIQNAENMHASDILSHTSDFLNDDDYFIYGCYSISKELTQSININNINNYYDIINHIYPISNIPATDEIGNKWYQHSLIKNIKINFCNAIYNKNIKKFGGFDEKYAYGICYDDSEFRDRMCKNLKSKSIDYCFVVHQHHDKSKVHHDKYHELYNLNLEIYNKQSI